MWWCGDDDLRYVYYNTSTTMYYEGDIWYKFTREYRLDLETDTVAGETVLSVTVQYRVQVQYISTVLSYNSSNMNINNNNISSWVMLKSYDYY